MPFVKQDYIIESKENTSRADPTSGGPNMSNQESFNNWLYSQFLISADEEREKDSSAFLLSAAESKLLNKANLCISNATAPYISISGTKPTEEQIKEIAKGTIKAFNENRLNTNRLKKLSQKIKTASYWSISPEYLTATNKNGFVCEAISTNYIISISTQAENKKITLDEKHPFFVAQNMRERVQSLNISDWFLYISKLDLSILENLYGLFSLLDTEQIKSESNGLMVLKSSPEYEFFVDSSIQSLNEAKTRKQTILTENGREQITITDILTNQGIKIEIENSIDDILAFKDPNTDKLFKQVMSKAISTHQPAVIITLDEYMNIRGLAKTKDAKKEARKNLEKAALFLYDLKIKSVAKKGNKKVGNTAPRIFRDRYIPEPGERNYHIVLEFDTYFFNDLMSNQQVICYPNKIQRIPNNKRNSYFFACKFLERKRQQNNHKRELDNRLSVRTLLNVSTIKKYNDLSDKGQFKQLIIDKFEKALDYLEKPEEEGGLYLFTYYFTKAKGEELTDAELLKMYSDYDFFESLMVNVVWYDDINYSNVHDKHKKYDLKRAAAAEKNKTSKTKVKRVAADPGTKAPAKDKPKPIKHTNPFKKDM